ncbi:hypothetical protein [Enterococcus larvae]|uniref:hypothetical protein n=1 Tax=Enterococcus larvae TaxID=2794352 RepID=UPI003F357293
MKKISMGLLAVGVLFFLASCGSEEATEKMGSATEETTSESEILSVSSESSEEIGVTEEDVLQKVIDQSFSDEEQGYTVTVQEMVTNIPGKREGDNYEGELFGVAIKVLVASTEKKLSSNFRGDFKLQVGNEVVKPLSYFSYFSEYAEEQEWKQLDSSVRSGETKEGWIIFALNIAEMDTPLTFRCDRSEIPVTVIGGDDYTIPAEEFSIELK